MRAAILGRPRRMNSKGKRHLGKGQTAHAINWRGPRRLESLPPQGVGQPLWTLVRRIFERQAQLAVTCRRNSWHCSR